VDHGAEGVEHLSLVVDRHHAGRHPCRVRHVRRRVAGLGHPTVVAEGVENGRVMSVFGPSRL
jgi:hypothetical protein